VHFGEGPNEREGQKISTDGDGTTVLPTQSSIKYTPPSASTKSGQASSTQESLRDSDDIPEAEAGGPDLASVSSTSRLSASLGVQEEEFANMHKSDPAGTLRLLLSKRQSQTNTSSEHTTSDSAPSNADINSMVRQDSLLLRLTTDFAQQDILKQLEEEPTHAYSHLAFLKKLHNPLTNDATWVKSFNLVRSLINLPKLCRSGMRMTRDWLLKNRLRPCFMRRHRKHKLKWITYVPK
jgi:hypothetical protein